jgi:hypothetical protein
MRFIRWAPLTAVAALAAAGCSGGPTSIREVDDPVPGTATVEVTSNPDGATAFVLTVSGGAVTDVRGAAGTVLFWEPTPGGGKAVALTSGPASGALLSFQVADGSRLGQYYAQPLQAADRRNEVLAASTVTLTVRPTN